MTGQSAPQVGAQAPSAHNVDWRASFLCRTGCKSHGASHTTLNSRCRSNGHFSAPYHGENSHLKQVPMKQAQCSGSLYFQFQLELLYVCASALATSWLRGKVQMPRAASQGGESRRPYVDSVIKLPDEEPLTADNQYKRYLVGQLLHPEGGAPDPP